CYPSCTNMDFEQGTLYGWTGGYAVDGACTYTGYSSAPLGPIQSGAYDPNTGTNQVHMESTANGNDNFLLQWSPYIMSKVSPFGGKYSVMLGDSLTHNQG